MKEDKTIVNVPGVDYDLWQKFKKANRKKKWTLPTAIEYLIKKYLADEAK